MNGKQLIEWVLHETSVPAVDDVCTMPGRSHGECWGCPITTCPRQVSPFEIAVVDADVIEKAIQKLKNNQIWVGSASGRQVLSWLGDNPAAALVGLLVESRERFLLNQAIEAVVSGHKTIEEAAASVHYLSKDNRNPKNVNAFRRMVAERVSR